MSLTVEDIQIFKELLKEHSADTELKINTAITNLEHRLSDSFIFENVKLQVALESQIRTSEDNVNKRIDHISHRVDNLSELFDGLTHRVVGLSQRVDDLSHRVEDLSTRVDHVQTSVDTLTVRVDDLAVRVDDLAVRVDQVSLRVDDIAQQVDYLQTTMEDRFDNISVKMVDFIGIMHSDHDVRLSKLESNINPRKSN